MVTLTRDFTATTFVVQGDRTLLIYHKKIRMWLPPGGHIDPNELPCDAAVREVREETGLEVELLSPRSAMGGVRVLSQPVCILLEKIVEGHEHIDLIYFGRVVGGALAPSLEETEGCRWCTAQDLGSPDIAEDIRTLGRRAIQSAEKT
ncbi:MAG: NUDIX domain-containing protein [Candidatus Latescibacteria bacterium]|nr:NUDIX domain-containing protein [Candidatus Latescibacterota bacterium]